MNAGTVSTTQEALRADSVILEIPLEKICESKTNPRTHFDETALAELAANVKQHGVLQPVLLRPHPSGESGGYELVVGSWRYRASKLAPRDTIPATIRELTDTQVVELQLDNLLREDVHELDEANGYASLQQLDNERRLPIVQPRRLSIASFGQLERSLPTCFPAPSDPALSHCLSVLPFFSHRSQAPRATERLRPAARRSSASLLRLCRFWFLPLRRHPPRKQTLALGSSLALAPSG